ncbi:MAG TPA: tetratricopeptide repeat protein, partial [Methanobacteriaceae archaeon]|nr:tetratricopeptide repeat protein [Methanobacteriaceae archaeon]
MPILSFGSRNIDLITGKKTMTIRKLWKKPLKVGDRLHCYWNLVSKERNKIFEAEVTDVEVLSFDDLIKNDKLAQEEGFRDSKELSKEFKKMYLDEIKDETLFQIIRFKKLPIEEWEGEKINEKAMITQRADILFDSGKYHKSEMCYTAALKFDPQDIYILNKKGDNLTRLGRFKEALQCYNKALEIEPENEYILNNKAITLLNSGAPEKALECSNKAVKINPHNAVILYWRGFILEMLGNTYEALETYKNVLKIDSKNPEVWNARGNLLNDLGKTEKALESYDKALELVLKEDPNATAWNRKGNALLELGRFEEALNCYEEALSLDNKNDMIWTNKGV